MESRRSALHDGKTAHVRIKRLEGDSTEIRTWGAHERISVKRVTAEEGKR